MRRSGGARRKSPRQNSPRRKGPRQKSGRKIRRSKRRLRGGVLKGVQHQLDQIWRQRGDTDVPNSMSDQFALNMPISVTDVARDVVKLGAKAAASMHATEEIVIRFTDALEKFREFTDLLWALPIPTPVPAIDRAHTEITNTLEIYNGQILSSSADTYRLAKSNINLI